MGGITKQESLALCAFLLDGSRGGEASVTAILADSKSVCSSIFSQYIVILARSKISPRYVGQCGLCIYVFAFCSERSRGRNFRCIFLKFPQNMCRSDMTFPFVIQGHRSKVIGAMTF